jgi:hypothetical protein
MSNENETALQGPGDDDDPDFRPALPPADFDFLVYSMRLQTELNLGLPPTEEQSALDNSVTELRFQFLQARHEESRQEEPKPQ